MIVPKPPAMRPPPRPPAALVRRRIPMWVYIAFALLISLAIAVIFLLPDMRPAPQVGVSASRANRSKPPARDDAAAQRQALARRQAEAALHEVLDLQAKLDNQSVRRWAQADYAAALERLAAGDVARQAGRFSEARETYQSLITSLTNLLESRPKRLRDALKRGADALSAFDAATAKQQFTVALAIEPNNAKAEHGLARTQHLDEVHALFMQGKAHEQQSQWLAAHDAYAKAVRLDADFTLARRGLSRTNTQLEKIRWHDLLTRFYRAMDRGELAKASETLKKIKAQRPKAPELGQAVKQLVNASQKVALDKLREKGKAQMAAEDFAAALGTYDKALLIDATVAFAQAGRSKAQKRLRLANSMQDILAHPRGVFGQQSRQNARQILAQAEEIDEVGPAFSGLRQRLQQLLTVAESPSRVTLVSDGQTQVTVYKIGVVGKFASRELRLLPGAYVAVGSRSGYRDVRVEFRVEPGPNPLPIRVVCQDQL